MSIGGSIPDIPTEYTFSADPIFHYKTRSGFYPSNAEVWWSMKRPLEIGSDTAPKYYLEVFDPALRSQITTGGTPAPKGHFILRAFYQDRTQVSDVANLPIQSSGVHRPSCVAFFAGRVFYSGVNTAGYNTKIYFTQILERPEQVQSCHQAFDPTDEDVRDLLPSDGGVIVIPEASEIYHMLPSGQSLFIFAKNGVWQILGSEGLGFRANDYTVSQVSKIGAISSSSFVIVEGSPLWWNNAGIYTLVTNPAGNSNVQSLTDETIRSFFNDIPAQSKMYCKGTYDASLSRVQWLYRSSDAESESDIYKYDRILNLDTKSGAWFPYTIPSNNNIAIRGLFSFEGLAYATELEPVVVENELVESDGEDVITLERISRPISTKIKYVVDVSNTDLDDGLVFAEEYNDVHEDFISLGDEGLPYESYMISGPLVLGEGNKKFQSNYITINHATYVDGGAFLQGVWDYAVTGNSGRWSSKQQIYRDTSDYQYGMRRLKLRGHGKALQIKITSQFDKPFKINGWSIFASANSGV